MLIIAHRGASGYKPQNTIEAFQTAIEMGADFVELDVQQTADDKLVVWHDTRFDDGAHSDELTYRELIKRADAKGIDVPLFSEVLEALGGRIGINVEVKCVRIIDRLLDEIASYDTDKLILSSFNHKYIDIIRKKNPDYKLGTLLVSRLLDPIPVLSSLNSDILIQHFEHVDKEYVELAHKSNKQIFAWNINNQRDMQEFKDMGVDGIFTDYPDLAAKIK